MMGWSLGYDEDWKRDVGYGVPAICDHPDCSEEIDRGLSYVCGDDIYGGDRGCGLYFCSKHQVGPKQLCERCYPRRRPPFVAKPDTLQWLHHKMTDESWHDWRVENGLAEFNAATEVARLAGQAVAEIHRDGNDGSIRLVRWTDAAKNLNAGDHMLGVIATPSAKGTT